VRSSIGKTVMRCLESARWDGVHIQVFPYGEHGTQFYLVENGKQTDVIMLTP